MPLHIPDRKTKKLSPLPLEGEISEKDWGGPSRCDWYYGTFETPVMRYNSNPEFARMKRELAQWLNDPANRNGPYYIHESYESGHGGEMAWTLYLALLNPRDMGPFQAAWVEHFKFDSEAVRKNLKMDISRIEEGFVPDDTRLREVYEIYKSEVASGLDEQGKIDRLISAYAQVFPPQPQPLPVDESAPTLPSP